MKSTASEPGLRSRQNFFFNSPKIVDLLTTSPRYELCIEADNLICAYDIVKLKEVKL